MDPTHDIAALSSCTTCRFKEDKSNYWTAALYFKHRNGSFIRVNQMSNHNTGPGLQAGGMTIYYFQPVGEFSIFPKGFRMTVGNPMYRKDSFDPTNPAAKATSFRCFTGPDQNFDPQPGWGPDDSYHLPNGPCASGIRSNIYFPQCWDGVNIDSPDHQSHVVHPVGDPTQPGNVFFGTPCPASHPVRLPELFYEIVWDTRPFNDPEMWPEDGSQPFVFSMGDPYGFGQHADYMFGWEGDSLQRAMSNCTGGTGIPWDCPALTLQDMDVMNTCRQAVKVPEVVEGTYLDKLPGCNPIQDGPQSATMAPNCGAVSTTIVAPVPTFTPMVVTPPYEVCSDGSNPNEENIVPRCSAYPGPTQAHDPRGIATGLPITRIG
ncbi:hypothetical protein CPB83DRAFT_899194 [Crepidotus variabilis]|uniref:DUF1996 domain-containing protein n=1 Tax=Crepidotus variabilis TaxID=179855 RepID=A0A9P6JJG2_9AGAR|nr:hypothetical protein CPB83DRAFT_899194 [Crepidotus variabilis]